MDNGGVGMKDVRLKTTDYTFDGKTFVLRCNMNVLADVQELFGGEIAAAFSNKSALKTCLAFLTAMLNDYADEQGWPEHYTVRQVGRLLPPTELDRFAAVIMPLVTSAMQGEDDEKNAETTGSQRARASTSRGI